MHKTAIIDVVGLTPGLIGPHTPRLQAFRDAGGWASIQPALPAVTCSAQSTYLTGTLPAEHGIVGNGWYFRDECEIKFWRQSNRLVQRPKIWERARELDPQFTCANMFWWFNMYSSVDVSVTPRPMYPADGRKLPDVWASPEPLRGRLQSELGQFPLFQFWGPGSSIASSQWIADATRLVDQWNDPNLSLVYLPHLDYGLQKYGPDDSHIAEELRAVDTVCGELIDHFQAGGANVVILSEYGIQAVSRPVHLNRLLREGGLLAVREEMGHELLDAGVSRAFAVADHQVAHVYVNDADCLGEVRGLLERTAGVAAVLDMDGKRANGLDHERSGELVAVAEPDAWFTYYYWMDDERAPDYARTVEIHRKPGYDPVELFLDPAISLPKLRIGATLLKRKIGFRTLLDVIPLDASLVRGSHGRVTTDPLESPMLMTNRPALLDRDAIHATDVCQILLSHLQHAA
ncbi:MAG TPA: nucleotide pyrophosphatase/phosphodiesterase family protein [Chloroflexota bacterium]|nr:nucleotide pyrophosphatase/phosphodiesterase family protein [Chloroflexota bacterium]